MIAMRLARFLAAATALLALGNGALLTQTPAPAADREPKDEIVVRGCITGTRIESVGNERNDSTSLARTNAVYELTGSRAMMRRVRELQGMLVEAGGTLEPARTADGETPADPAMRVTRKGRVTVFAGRRQAPTHTGDTAVPPKLRLESLEEIAGQCPGRP